MKSSRRATVTTSASFEKNAAMRPPASAKTTPHAAMKAMATSTALFAAASASGMLRLPSARPTITLAASAIATPGRNDTRMTLSAIVCAAIWAPPIPPSTAVNVAKASDSTPNWRPVGTPSSATSRVACFRDITGSLVACAARARFSAPTRSTAIAASSRVSVVAVAQPPPRTPIAGSPRCP